MKYKVECTGCSWGSLMILTSIEQGFALAKEHWHPLACIVISQIGQKFYPNSVSISEITQR